MDVLLVGLGRWGEKHLRVLRELGVGLWVADVSPARLAWAVKQGVEPARAVADYRAALPRVAAVDVVTPADSHRAMRRGVPRRGPPLLPREAAARDRRRGPRAGGGGARRGARAAGGPHLPLPPGDRDAPPGARRRPPRGRPLRDGPVLGLQAAAHGRRRDPDRRDPLLRPV